MTPLASVAILEKLALSKIALCRASAPSAFSLGRIFDGLSGFGETQGIMFSDSSQCGRAAKIGNVDNLGVMVAGRSRAFECLIGSRDQITWDGTDSGTPCSRARKI